MSIFSQLAPSVSLPPPPALLGDSSTFPLTTELKKDDHPQISLSAGIEAINKSGSCSAKEEEKKFIKKIKSIHVKILMNFLQMLSIITLLNLNWSPTMSDVLVAQNSMSGWFLKFISFDCLYEGSIVIFNI
jgi:hypothetical protein